jgi:uncharacterized UBP type Zn finger protein
MAGNSARRRGARRKKAQSTRLFHPRHGAQRDSCDHARMKPTCPHTDQIRDVTPSANGCEECLKMGDQWVHLRMCLSCGHVGCCDSSKNKHATKHFHASKHPIMRSLEPGETWGWCYVDELMFPTM